MRALTITALLVSVGLLGLAAAESGSVTASMPSPLPMPADSERRLAAGEIIVLDVLPPGASPDAQGGTAVALVRAPVEKVWSILIDYEGHPRYYPRLASAEVLERSDGRALVRYTAAVGFLSFTFYMDKTQDPVRHRIEWQLASGHSNSLFRENSGYWQVDPHDGASLVAYALAVRTVLPGFLTRSSERNSLSDTITGLRRLAEPS
jgi:ribosome-associated toxin RatA of RatAB toxin-antitoxin module